MQLDKWVADKALQCWQQCWWHNRVAAVAVGTSVVQWHIVAVFGNQVGLVVVAFHLVVVDNHRLADKHQLLQHQPRHQ